MTRGRLARDALPPTTRGRVARDARRSRSTITTRGAATTIYCCYYCRKSSELKAKQDATTPLLADPQTFPVVVPAGAGPGSKIRVKNPQTGADVNVIVPAGITAGMQFLVPLKPAADENI